MQVDYLAIGPKLSPVDNATIQLQTCLRQLNEWLTTNLMSVEKSKFFLLVVTLSEYQLTLTLAIMGLSIPVREDKKILYITIGTAVLR